MELYRNDMKIRLAALYFKVCDCIRIETGLGHPGHILSGWSGSHPVYKYSGLTRIMFEITYVDNGIWP